MGDFTNDGISVDDAAVAAKTVPAEETYEAQHPADTDAIVLSVNDEVIALRSAVGELASVVARIIRHLDPSGTSATLRK